MQYVIDVLNVGNGVIGDLVTADDDDDDDADNDVQVPGKAVSGHQRQR